MADDPVHRGDAPGLSLGFAFRTRGCCDPVDLFSRHEPAQGAADDVAVGRELHLEFEGAMSRVLRGLGHVSRSAHPVRRRPPA